MGLVLQDNGNLPAGIHNMAIEDFEKMFGYTDYRAKLISGLKVGMSELKQCGCQRIFIDGSFTTSKEVPGDFDSCWDLVNVDLEMLKLKFPVILDFSNQRKNQKDKYFGEFFPAQLDADPYDIYLDFFQKDRDGNPKGIIQIDLI